MKRILSIIAMAVISTAFVVKANAQVRDLDIDVTLNNDGSAHIVEVWDLNAFEGTEWYLVRSNLGDIEVSNLSVKDGNNWFQNIGSWNVDRSMSEKAGQCGIVSKSNGCEICWGLGSYGDHVFTVSYDMSNVVKSLNDYDMVHMQFVNPGLSSPPEHVRVKLHTSGVSFDDNNSRIWGFGYYGSQNYSDGDIVFESSEAFQRNSSVIALVRFNKGFFNSSSVQDKSFDDVLDKAMEGSAWEDSDDDSIKGAILGSLVALLMGIFVVRAGIRKNNMNVLGVKSLKEISWSRNIPFNGNIVESEYILAKLGNGDLNNRIAASLILRMIQNGNLTVQKDAKDKVEICFNDSVGLDPASIEGRLYAMMKEASGDDQILQDKEFSRWSKKHLKRVSNWVDSVSEHGRKGLINDKWMVNGKFTEASKANARNLIGLKKFLKDFTINDERSVNEVILWQDYLVFAALFGVADKVAKELRDINPQKFDEVMPYDYTTMNQVLYSTNNLSRSITNAKTSYTQKSGAAGGHGGVSSFGGGGGFSGGGFGGGAR